MHILGWFWYMRKDLPMCPLCKSIFVACMQGVHKFVIDYICLLCLFVYLFHLRSCLCFVWQGHIIISIKICIYMYYDTHTIYLFLCKIIKCVFYVILNILCYELCFKPRWEMNYSIFKIVLLVILECTFIFQNMHIHIYAICIII